MHYDQGYGTIGRFTRLALATAALTTGVMVSIWIAAACGAGF